MGLIYIHQLACYRNQFLTQKNNSGIWLWKPWIPSFHLLQLQLTTGTGHLVTFGFQATSLFFFFSVSRLSETLYRTYLDFKKDFFLSENPVYMSASSDIPNYCRSVSLKYRGLALGCADLWVSDTRGRCWGRYGPQHWIQWKPPPFKQAPHICYTFVLFTRTNMPVCSTTEGVGGAVRLPVTPKKGLAFTFCCLTSVSRSWREGMASLFILCTMHDFLAKSLVAAKLY